MKIHLLSDTHNEFKEFTPSSSAKNTDIVVLAGDIDIKARGIAWARKTFACPVLYVPGNHEFYNGHLTNTLKKMRLEACDRVHVMDNDEFIFKGVRFLGATGWTDYSLTGNVPLAELDAQQELNDFKKIREDGYRKVRPLDFLKRNSTTKNWLRDRLNESFDGLTVVITHHAPSILSLRDHCRNSDGSHLDAAYANRWESLMGGSLALWLHGHSHFSVDYDLYGTRVISNPCGYPGEATGFDADLLIDLDELSLSSKPFSGASAFYDMPIID